MAMEYSSYKIKTSYREENLNLHVIYRLLSCSVIVFCNELLETIEQEINEICNTLYISNLNIHMDSPHHLDTITFHDFLQSFNLKNLITEATHKSQHTLNLIITDKSSNTALKPELGHMLSDHSLSTAISTWQILWGKGPNHTLWSQENWPAKSEGVLTNGI